MSHSINLIYTLLKSPYKNVLKGFVFVSAGGIGQLYVLLNLLTQPTIGTTRKFVVLVA